MTGFNSIFAPSSLRRGALMLLLACSLPSLVSTNLLRAQKDTSDKKSTSSTSQDQNNPREKAPSLIDPAGPTISLVPSEQVFIMASALNMCGYDEGLSESSPIRQRVRDDINKALAASENARDVRDQLCLYIAQHKLTGTLHDISQYVSLALYLSPPPELETTAELPEMPPDSTQVIEILPLLRKFATAVDLHGIWLIVKHTYDEEVDKLHDPMTKMIVDTNLYLKMPASTYDGRHFIVVIEPLLSPSMVNARVYGLDYVVVLSPVEGKIRMADVKHTYLHYIIEPLLYSRSNAIDREQPILKELREAPMDFIFRTDTVALTVECMIKAIEARTMDTGIPVFVMPSNADRSEYAKLDQEKQAYQKKVNAIRWAAVMHDQKQGFTLTQYFYEQMMIFEHDPASLKDTMGEMVYSMDVDQQARRAKETDFDKEADGDVLRRVRPKKLEGLDLAEARLAAGDVQTARAMAQSFLTVHESGAENPGDTAHALFILARVNLMSGHPEDAITGFHKVLALSKDLRLLSWSHIYLGRMLDLSCRRDAALDEYKAALETRDGQMDTRVAAERGVKTVFAVKGHSCSDSDDDDKDEPITAPKK